MTTFVLQQNKQTMSITTDFKNMPILDVDYGASNMAGFGGLNYFNWTYEEYKAYCDKVTKKSAIKSQNRKQKQTTPIIHYKNARK